MDANNPLIGNVNHRPYGSADEAKPETIAPGAIALSPEFCLNPRRTAALARHATQIYKAPVMFRLCKTFEKNQNSLKETFFGKTGEHCADLMVDKCFLLGRFSLTPTGFLRFAEDG